MKFKNCIKNISICMLMFLSLSNKSYAIEKIDSFSDEVPEKIIEWITDFTDMPTARQYLSSQIVDDKLYCIGGNDSTSQLSSVEIYDTTTDTWSIGEDMPTPRNYLGSVAVEDKIYCIGGWGGPILKTVEIYDIETDTWSTGAEMSIRRNRFTANVIDEKIYCIGGYSSICLKSIEVFSIRDITPEEIAQRAVEKAEKTPTIENIEDARLLVNSLPESIFKDELQNRLNNLFDSSMDNLELKNITSNIDIYFKPKNTLIISLNTNNITFDDFSGVEDLEKANAVNIGISSSLSYQLNTYLPTEIQNADKTNIMDKQILNIKENSEVDYKEFANINEKVVLKDNCPSGNDLIHGIDIKLKGGILHKKDVYKTTIKFEAEQK